jgi:hypothetical protein
MLDENDYCTAVGNGLAARLPNKIPVRYINSPTRAILS